MAINFSGDFARLTPRNHIAQLLFSETYVSVEKNDTFHVRLMERTGSEPSRDPSAVVEDSSDYDTGPGDETGDSVSRTIQHLGHFILSFDQSRHPEMPHLGWRIGKGTSKSPANRGVDLLLSRPGDILSKSLASIHMLFRFNSKSGFLMLVGGSSRADVEFNMGGTWEKLGNTEQRLMHQSTTMLRAGLCEYELEYTVPEEHRESYFEQRNTFFEKLSSSTSYIRPPRPFQHLPGDSCIPRGRYLEFETQGFGASGWVTCGVDTITGDCIAIKELRINSRRSRVEAIEEVEFGRRFLNYRGLLPTLDAWCEHGQAGSCSDIEKFHIFMPQGVSAFSPGFLLSPEIPQTRKLHWLREILEGVETLHVMGIMHRDIRPQNMLIMSTDPPRACLCDYGKAIEASTGKVTTIGPVHTLAPEVWLVLSDGPYTEKIDMWAYGYAVAEILGYSTSNTSVTHKRHQAILEMLCDHRRKAPEDGALVDLVLKLLKWRPGDRWSATRALGHECWAPIMDSPVKGKRRTECDDDNGNNKENDNDNDDDDNDDDDDVDNDEEERKIEEIPTQIFSQRTKDHIRRTYT